MYNVFQFLHVSAAIIWLGSGFGLVALNAVMTKGDRTTAMAVGRHMETLGPRLFGPAAMGTLLFGILTVLAADSISFGDPWIGIGFAGVALSLVIVGLSNGVNKRLVQAMEAHGPDSPEAASAAGRARLLNYVDLALLFIVVWAMVTKPGA